VQRLGNLSLLSKKLNVDVSNSGWNASKGKDGKREVFVEKDLLQMNKKLLEVAQDDWNEEKIAERTDLLINAMLDIWKVPSGHTVSFNSPKQEEKVYVEIADLLEYGSLHAGQILYPKQQKHEGKNAEILLDGRLALGDQLFLTPSGAGEYLRKRATNGWRFWLVDKDSMKSLGDVRAEYRDSLSIEPDDSDLIEDTDE
jgi:hypothetical protein